MKLVRASVLTWCCFGLAGLGLAAAKQPAPTLPTVSLYGHEFVSLESWASTQRLTLRWTRTDGEVRLTNRWAKLAFTVDSRRAEINGLKVWLSAPITPYRQGLYVATLDLATLLQPLLQPAHNQPGHRVRTIALDPGHGGKDPGFQVGAEREKKHTLLLARQVQGLLEEAGLKVVLTRSTDRFIDLSERTAIARHRRADLFVSLHYNASNPGKNSKNSSKGIEVYCLTPAGAQSTNVQGTDAPARAAPGNVLNAKNILLAYQLQSALVRNLDAEDRGVRRARFQVLREATMPAVLIEGGFLTDPKEAQEILSPAYRAEMARAIVDGILAYKRLVER
jgi:N-acetylmuramoyl-L-alanine amidase